DDRWITDLNRSEDSSNAAHRCQCGGNFGWLRYRQRATFPNAYENRMWCRPDFCLCRMRCWQVVCIGDAQYDSIDERQFQCRPYDLLRAPSRHHDFGTAQAKIQCIEKRNVAKHVSLG